MAEIKALCKDEKSFVDSTLSMRLNAFVAGDLSKIAFQQSLKTLDMKADIKKRIWELVEGR
jgi:hypothetical protein